MGAADGPTVVLHGHLDVVPGQPRAVRAARGGRPPLRPRRLRHEGRAGGDDVRGPRPGRAGRGEGALRLRLRRGVRRAGASAAPTTWWSGATSATSRSPASPPTSTSGSRPRACWLSAAGVRALGARRHAVAGRQRGGQGGRRLPRIESLPFARESSDLFDRPSISLGLIMGGDAVNRVPDACPIDLDIRYLPGQDPDEIIEAVGSQPDAEIAKVFHREPIVVARDEPLREGARRGGVEGDPVESKASPWAAMAPQTSSRSSTPGSRGRVRPHRGWPPRARGVGVDRVARQLP